MKPRQTQQRIHGRKTVPPLAGSLPVEENKEKTKKCCANIYQTPGGTASLPESHPPTVTPDATKSDQCDPTHGQADQNPILPKNKTPNIKIIYILIPTIFLSLAEHLYLHQV